MIPINDYPEFVAAQVLTADHLNEMFNYQDEQNRLTRSYLIGIGIVCGLDAYYTSTEIVITKGVGVTSLGYLIQFDGGSHTYARSYQLPDDIEPDIVRPYYNGFTMWKLFTPAIGDPVLLNDHALKDSAFLQDKVVVLFLEWTITDLKDCTTDNCDDKGKLATFTIQPLLMLQKDLSKFKYGGFEIAKASLPDIVLKRYNIPFKPLKSATEIINAFYALTDATTLKNISEAYSNAYNTFKPMLSTETTDPFSNMLTTLNAQLNDIKVNRAVLTEYYYDFIDDLVKAYDEFREKGNSLLIECCPDGNLFPFHLALTEALIDSRSNISAYRNYFIHSPVFGMQKSLGAELQLLFNRMKLLLTSFALPDIQAEEQLIKITPSKYGDYYLSQRAVPFYYATSPLVSSWSYDKTSKGKASRNLSYNANLYSTDDVIINPLNYEIEPNNFFRIEGHVGKQVDEALTDIVSQKQKFSLPIDVVAINTLVGSGEIDAANAKCHFSDLESLYNILTAQLLCMLHKPVCFLSKLHYFDLSRPSPVFKPILASGEVDTGDSPGAKEPGFNSPGFISAPGFEEINQAISYPPGYMPINQSFIDQAKMMSPYIKGTFLKHFCDPKPVGEIKSVGQVYLETIQKNPGAYPRPVGFDAAVLRDISALVNMEYAHFFYFIDCVEELIATILPKYLRDFDLAAFLSRYSLLFQEAQAFGLILVAIKAYFQALKEPPQTGLEIFIRTAVIDFLINEMEMVTHLCMDEKIEALVNEYRKRINDINLENIFSNYSTHHPGLDHKAGVPKGGTFIMVYQQRPDTQLGISTTSSFNLPLQSINKAEDLRTIDNNETTGGQVNATVQAQSSSLMSACTEMAVLNKDLLTAQEFATLTNLLIKINTTEGTTINEYNIKEGVVFADFYLPYMCCSDCAPISYIIQDNTIPERKPVIALSRDVVCNTNTEPLKITVHPAGGVLSLTSALKINDTTYQVAISDLPVGDTTITYTANGQSVSAKVTILVAAEASFTHQPIAGKPGAVQFKSNAQGAGLGHLWNFGDPGSGTGNTSFIAEPVHEYLFDAGSAQFNVTHTVTVNDICRNSALEKITVIHEQLPSIELSGHSVCVNASEPLIITVHPAGGTISLATAKKINEATYQVEIKDLPLGDTIIVYTSGSGQASSQVTVRPAPSAGFTAVPIPGKPSVIQFTSNDTNAAINHQWEFGDPQSGQDNKTNERNPQHAYRFTAPAQKFSVIHTTLLGECSEESKQEIEVANTNPEVTETKTFCFEREIQLEDPASITDSEVLNLEELKPLLANHQITINEKLLLTFGTKLKQEIRFTIQYALNNHSITKNVMVTIIGLNAGFNVSINNASAEFVFTALAAQPEKVNWKLTTHVGKPDNPKTFEGTGKEFRLAANKVAEISSIDIGLVITEESGQATCRESFTKKLSANQLAGIGNSPNGKDFES